MRKIEFDIVDKDYLDFLSACVDEDLSAENKLKNIIKYNVIVYRNRRKLKNQRLFSSFEYGQLTTKYRR
ncbi:MAG: hypothetical protein LVO36_03850 [Nitrosopumilus sp. (ex Thoosa mismalolli)]|nr:hypothetical protein [Nitrosopumilus sp. (ex Thoosa mismalolli)]